MLNTSGCAFSISSNSTTVYGRRLRCGGRTKCKALAITHRQRVAVPITPPPCCCTAPPLPIHQSRAPDCLRQLAALVVAHIAGGRANELGHGVPLHELRHIQAHLRKGAVKALSSVLTFVHARHCGTHKSCWGAQAFMQPSSHATQATSSPLPWQHAPWPPRCQSSSWPGSWPARTCPHRWGLQVE